MITTNQVFLSFSLSSFLIVQRVKKIVEDKLFWEATYVVTRALFPVLRILRLADKSAPGMDKLYYYLRQTDRAIENSLAAITTLDYFKEYRDGDDEDDEYDAMDAENNDDHGEEFDGDGQPDDDDDNNEDDDDDSIDSVTDGLGPLIKQIWEKRCSKMETDYAMAGKLCASSLLPPFVSARLTMLFFVLTGWLLSPLPDIVADAKTHQRLEHRTAMDRVLDKLHYKLGPVERGDTKNKFWEEHELFHSRKGPFETKYIWNSKHLLDGNSHLWHAQCSLHCTEVLGRVACIVTSKILGIGNAERQWGAVKKLKSNQRASLSAEKTKKQSTIYGAACIRRSRLRTTVRTAFVFIRFAFSLFLTSTPCCCLL